LPPISDPSRLLSSRRHLKRQEALALDVSLFGILRLRRMMEISSTREPRALAMRPRGGDATDRLLDVPPNVRSPRAHRGLWHLRADLVADPRRTPVRVGVDSRQRLPRDLDLRRTPDGTGEAPQARVPRTCCPHSRDSRCGGLETVAVRRLPGRFGVAGRVPAESATDGPARHRRITDRTLLTTRFSSTDSRERRTHASVTRAPRVRDRAWPSCSALG
jgi:hypothetical protein